VFLHVTDLPQKTMTVTVTGICKGERHCGLGLLMEFNFSQSKSDHIKESCHKASTPV
jgi:hypothetical protein